MSKSIVLRALMAGALATSVAAPALVPATARAQALEPAGLQIETLDRKSVV